MTQLPIKVGSVVISKKGRDVGDYFLVVKVEEDYLYLCNGDTRKLAFPKKKNIKHVTNIGETLDILEDKLNSGKKIFDSELQSALRNLVENKG
ncbi:MAG: KOW domain-containing RNA-binding protein [Clostridia bacterium]